MVAVVLLLLFILYTWVLRPNLTQLWTRHQAVKSRRLNASFLPFSPRFDTFDSDDLENQTTKSSENVFWKTQTSRLLLCLFFSDLIQSISGVIQLHWTAIGRIEDNTACKIQGAFLHLGDVATAIWSAGIAFLTFVHIVAKVNPRDWMIVAFIIFGWTFAVILSKFGVLLSASLTMRRYNWTHCLYCFGGMVRHRWWMVFHNFLLPPPSYLPSLCAYVLSGIHHSHLLLSRRTSSSWDPHLRRARSIWMELAMG
jgi:hypothetical protein